MAVNKKYERTEDEITGMSPISVRLGEKDYKLKPRTITAAQEWRGQLNETMRDVLMGFLPSEGESSKAISRGMVTALLQFPEKVVELVFSYAPDDLQPKDEILATATEEQMAVAYSKIMVVAYPFLAQLEVTLRALREQVLQQ